MGGHAQTANRLMYRGDDDGRCVEGVESRPLDAVVFRWRQQRCQFLAHFLPSGILVFAGDGIGEYREGDRPKASEAGKGQFLFRCRRAAFLFDGLQGADSGDDVAGFGLFATGDAAAWMCWLMPGRVIALYCYCRLWRFWRRKCVVGGWFKRKVEKAMLLSRRPYFFGE